MPNIQHFEVLADDVERAKNFYESAFGWRFNRWGAEDNFYQIRTGPQDNPGTMGAVAPRREIGGERIAAYLCTIDVDDLDKAAKSIEAAGGKVISETYNIPTVGHLFHFVDTEGNVASAMQYEHEHS
ncbi:MAG: VOC family protein [Dehalococcoidia bacterium]